MSAGALQVVLDGDPVVGQEAGLSVRRDGRPVVGQPLVETAWAGAVDARQRTLGTTDATGGLRWTPETAGLTQLELGGDRVVFAVAPASLAPGLTAGLLSVTLLVAALVLAWRSRS